MVGNSNFTPNFPPSFKREKLQTTQVQEVDCTNKVDTIARTHLRIPKTTRRVRLRYGLRCFFTGLWTLTMTGFCAVGR